MTAPTRRPRLGVWPPRPAHLERVGPFVERGRVLFGGTILDEAGDMVGSVVLADFATREELDAWVAEDPYVTSGVWQGGRDPGLPSRRRRLAAGGLTPPG